MPIQSNGALADLVPPRGRQASARSSGWDRALTALLLVVTALLVVLHYLHLRADLPHSSPWKDPVRFTDEGWYAGAAIRQFLSGGWYLPGDFNLGVTFPAFPVLAALVFHFTGISVVALRALNVTLFTATLLVAWLLVRRYSVPLAAAAAAFLIACSPFYYVYSRLGTLEPLLVFESLLALLVASTITRNQFGLRYKLPSFAVGILLASLFLTKTQGVCIYPAVFYLMASRCDFSLKTCLRPFALAAGTAAPIVLAYYAAVRRAGLIADYDDIYAINKGDHVHGRILLPMLWTQLKECAAIGPSFYYLAFAGILLFLITRRKRQAPLFMAAFLGFLGYGAFIVYRSWHLPHYYYDPLPFMAIALVLALAEMAQSPRLPLRLAAGGIAAALLVVTITQIRTLITWSRHPSYSYIEAAERIYQVINRDPSHNRVVLSSVSEQIGLLADEHGTFLNPTYGTTPLSERILRYKPGWEITFSPNASASSLYSERLVDTEPVYGREDPVYSDLYLYKLTLNQP